MKTDFSRTLDDMVFENRNKEYGSYRLRKQYHVRLVIGFFVSLAFVSILVFSYLWYLNSAGNATVYLYSSSNPYLKSVEGSMMSPEEINAYLNQAISPEELLDNETKQADPLLNFEIAEDPVNDTFTPPEERDIPPEKLISGTESSEDSVVFGGFLPGELGGGGPGSQIDRFPIFPGGAVQKYIESILYYPPQAVRQKINGVVLLSFVVNKSGDVVNVKVEKSVHPLLDAEAMKAVKSLPRWQPGLRHGRPISIQLVIRINFVSLN